MARITLGSVLTLDLLQRFGDLEALYSGRGALPLAIVRDRFPGWWLWSLHWLSGSAAYNSSILAVALIASVALTLGAWTRFATMASWFLAVSLHHRLPIVNNAGDSLLVLLLFWGMFLPLGRRWSVDAGLLASRKQRDSGSHPATTPPPAVCWASGAILLQMALVYGMSAYFKQHELWRSGEALHSILAFDAYGRPLARWLLEFPHLVTLLACATLWLETIGPLLLFSPWYTGTIRVIVVFLFLAMHLGIAVTLTVGWFGLVCFAGLWLFIPAEFWDGLARIILGSTQENTTQLPSNVRFADASPRSASHGSRSLLTLSGFLLITLIVVWNLDTAYRARPTVSTGAMHRSLIPSWIASPMIALGLDQQWDMFSRPTAYDGWITAIGWLANGEALDAWTGGAARDPMRSPVNPCRQYPNHRWRKLIRQLSQERYSGLRASVGKWLVDRWNLTNGTNRRFVYFVLDHSAEQIEPGGGPVRIVVTRWYSEGEQWLLPDSGWSP